MTRVNWQKQVLQKGLWWILYIVNSRKGAKQGYTIDRALSLGYLLLLSFPRVTRAPT